MVQVFSLRSPSLSPVSLDFAALPRDDYRRRLRCLNRRLFLLGAGLIGAGMRRWRQRKAIVAFIFACCAMRAAFAWPAVLALVALRSDSNARPPSTSHMRTRMNNLRTACALVTGAILAMLVSAATWTIVRAQASTIQACVNRASGEMKISTSGVCPVGSNRSSGVPGGSSAASNIYYVFEGMYPGTSVARAFCPAGTKVTGGGGVAIDQVGLRYSFPISDETGAHAFGTTAIGWQVAAEDWSDVQAFVVCVGP